MHGIARKSTQLKQWGVLAAFLSLTLWLGGCPWRKDRASDVITWSKQVTFDRDDLRRDLEFFTASPHPIGSARQEAVTAYIRKRSASFGADVSIQEFEAQLPNRALLGERAPTGPAALTHAKTGRNVVAFAGLPTDRAKNACVVILASHYDTKDIEGLNYVGANDSGSSSAALLMMLKTLQNPDHRARLANLTCAIAMVWFDGEEAYLANWDDGYQHPANVQDNTYGSRHLIANLQPCRGETATKNCLKHADQNFRVAAMLLLDMIGSTGVTLTRDANSTPGLLTLALNTAKELGLADIFAHSTKAIADDHEPFLKHGIPALNLIDFEHTRYWHAPGDTLANLDLESIQRVARLALALSLQVANNPKVFTP